MASIGYRAAKALLSRIVRSAVNYSVMSWSGCVEKTMGFVSWSMAPALKRGRSPCHLCTEYVGYQPK